LENAEAFTTSPQPLLLQIIYFNLKDLIAEGGDRYFHFLVAYFSWPKMQIFKWPLTARSTC